MGRTKTNQGRFVQTREPGTSMLTRKSKSEQETESSNKVFNNSLLMDKIMKYSIYKSNGKELDTKAVVAIRLVNKTWLQSASHTLKNSGDWLISLEIGCLYELPRRKNGVFLDKNEAIFDKFISVFTTASRSIDSILPIHFRMWQHFLVKDNCKTLSNFFEQFGNIICSLHITYPLNEGSMNLNGKSLDFPILNSFKFVFNTWRDPLTNLRMEAGTTSENNGLGLLQQILLNSSNLQCFTVGQYNDHSIVNFSSIRLPKSVKMMRLGSPFTANELTLVTNNTLPNLNALNLEIIKQSEVALVCKILERFGKQLKSLIMSVGSHDEESHIIVEFPSMEKLTYLKIIGEAFSLSPQLRNVWPKLVPNLTHLVFQEELSQSMFLDWVQGSRFENVEKLKFSLNGRDEESYDSMSPSVRLILQIITSFPKLHKLTLKYALNDITSLKYLFRSLTSLKKLTLSFEPDEGSHHGYELVSIFLGTSLELAKAMVDKTARNVNVSVDNPESIMNLKELDSLTLRSPPHYEYSSKPCQLSYYSRIISKYGLSKMPKLQKIKLLDGFKPLQ